MMEMNYMLSYGAAESSLLLLRRFNLLKVLLPFHVSGFLSFCCGLTDLGIKVITPFVGFFCRLHMLIITLVDKLPQC